MPKMFNLQLVTHPDARLTLPCTPVGPRVMDWVPDLVPQMRALMQRHQGIGLAAPQVGFNIRLFILRDMPGLPNGGVFINPTVEPDTSAPKIANPEGCLSIPDTEVMVSRHMRAFVAATDIEGQPFELTLEGLASRAAQHENDHLDGKLILDHAPPLII